MSVNITFVVYKLTLNLYSSESLSVLEKSNILKILGFLIKLVEINQQNLLEIPYSFSTAELTY